MKAVTGEQMREIDRRTISDFIPGEELMARAGEGVAALVRQVAARPCVQADHVVLVAGKGNNGGDAFVAARHLAADGLSIVVLLTAEPRRLPGDARCHFDRMVEVPGICWRHVPEDGWAEEAERLAGHRSVIVDGILGTGVRGPARGVAAAAIDCANALGRARPVVAIDVPSGMDADTGTSAGSVVTADETATIAFPKIGLLQAVATDHVGRITVVDIGIPLSLSDPVMSEVEMISPRDIDAVVQRRKGNTHKGSYGHVALIGGSPGFSGAIVLAARAALRSGIGLVSVLVPEGLEDIVASQIPECMVHAGKQGPGGELAGDSAERWTREHKGFSAVLVGPGMGVNRDTQALTERLLAGCRVPLLMDADALNACSHRMFLVKRADCPVVLTPHPGEMARLLAIATEDVQSDRPGVARAAAEATRSVVVLKGAGTIVAQHGDPLFVNASGNPGMATGGMGDALAGLMAGLAGQGIPTFDAARAAVYLHGRAGDLAAARVTPVGLNVSDVLHALPDALCELSREAVTQGGLRAKPSECCHVVDGSAALQ